MFFDPVPANDRTDRDNDGLHLLAASSILGSVSRAFLIPLPEAKSVVAADSVSHLDHSASNWSLIRRMLLLGWAHRATCFCVLLLNFLLVGLNLAGLGFTGLAIDVLRHALQPASSLPAWPFGWSPPSNWSPMSVVALVAGVVLGLATLQAIMKYVTAVASTSLSQAIVIQLRTDVYDKLQRLSFRFFDAHDSSSLINRVAGDVQAVRGFVDGVILKVLTVILSLGVYLAYMLSMHVSLALACLITSPLLWIGAVWFSRAVRPLYQKSSELGDTMVLRLSENVQGIQVVKGFAREEDEIVRFEAANRALRDQKFDIFWSLSVYQPAMGLLTQVGQLTLIGYGGLLVIQGELPLGAGLFVFANLIHEFANQVGQIINIANTIQSSLTGADRVFAVLDADIEIQSSMNAIPLPRARGEVVFEHVSFAYTSVDPSDSKRDFVVCDGNRPAELVLNDVSLTIRAGECIGIVGDTGSGKTTLLQLIARFYDVTSGRVLVDGTDVRQLNLHDLRRNIGFVFQESFLFSNTISANISFGLPGAEFERIEDAARLASAREFIAELPDGYASLIGEHGSNLSGGQRQRLAIARALLLDPPILMLDDATAAVDAETEHEIQRAIESMQHGRTTILVSSRISSVRHADRIYVMGRGRIVESGTHAELLRLTGEYSRLATLQLATDTLETEPAASQRQVG
jgi:ATP-binding cassette subfamily B protein